MVIDALTPEEVVRHRRAIEKIKRKLFARHTPDDFGIVPGSEEVLSATAEQLWCASIGEYRRVTLGGLRFTIAIGSSHFEMTVSHFEHDVFTLHIASERGHTELASRVRFDAVDRIAWAYVHNRQCVVALTKR